MTLTIGDRSRDGLLEIVDTRWDSNGTMFVTVRELIGTGCWVGGLPVERMRRLARRAIARPELTRSSRVTRRESYRGCDYVTFAVSRLDRLKKNGREGLTALPAVWSNSRDSTSTAEGITTMTETRTLSDRELAVVERVKAELIDGRNFTLAENSHRSRRGYMSCLTATEYGRVIERIGKMAQGGDKMAFVARSILPTLNLYGDRAQLCAAIFAGMREATREPFYDVRNATGPEGGRPSSHMKPWTLADMLILRAWGNVLTAGLESAVPGHGWALAHIAQEMNIYLPTVPKSSL